MLSRAGAYSFSISSGTAVKRSATSPKSATWKIGASSSLLMATMTFESFNPRKVLDRTGDADREQKDRVPRPCRSGRLASRLAHSPNRLPRGRHQQRPPACRPIFSISAKSSSDPHTTATRYDDTRRCQLGPVALGNLVLDPGTQARIFGSRDGLNGGGPPFCSSVKGRCPEGDDFFRVRGFHCLDRVTGINRALEGIAIDHTRGI